MCGRRQGLVDEYVHDTGFKIKILELIPCLIESKAGRFVLLTLKEDIGRALFEACRSSDEEEGMTLVRAASRIRRTLLINDEVFMVIYLRSVRGNLLPRS